MVNIPVVAEGDPARVHRSTQDFYVGVWHHPMIALDAPIDFTCLVWEDGSEGDCEVAPLPRGALSVAEP